MATNTTNLDGLSSTPMLVVSKVSPRPSPRASPRVFSLPPLILKHAKPDSMKARVAHYLEAIAEQACSSSPTAMSPHAYQAQKICPQTPSLPPSMSRVSLRRAISSHPLAASRSFLNSTQLRSSPTSPPSPPKLLTTPLSSKTLTSGRSWQERQSLQKEIRKAIAAHRDPQRITPETYETTALTNTYAKRYQQEFVAEYKRAHGGQEPDMHALVDIKERALQKATDLHFQENVAQGLYNPEVMPFDMDEILDIKPDLFLAQQLTTEGEAWKQLKTEIDTYYHKHLFNHEAALKTESLIKRLFDFYPKVYPTSAKDPATLAKTLLHRFAFCREMLRILAYQAHYDRSFFTGSAHEALHAYHNVENADTMRKRIEASERERCDHAHPMNEKLFQKVEFLVIVTHILHDIGYTVGAPDFNVKKDHPIISAKFVETLQEFFELYLGKKDTEIVKKAILFHAIVAFKADPTDLDQLVRFLSSNSDACAVAADEKTQVFWRDHPEALITIARLELFLSIFPQMAKKLESPDILTCPEKLFALKNPTEGLIPSNFIDPLEEKAYRVFIAVRDELLSIVDHIGTGTMPPEEKEAFKTAIRTSFNAASSHMVLAQYGIQLQEVSVERNPIDSHPPCYQYVPSIHFAPSPQFRNLHELSASLAVANLAKLGKEYGVSEAAIKAAVTDLISSPGQKRNLSSPASAPIAVVIVSHSASKAHHQYYTSRLRRFDDALNEFQQLIFPSTLRCELQHILSENENDLLRACSLLLEHPALLDDSTPQLIEILSNIQVVFDKIKTRLASPKPLTPEEHQQLFFELQKSLSLRSEWALIERGCSF